MKIKFFSLKMNLASGGGSHHTLDLKLRYLLSRGHQVSLTTLYSGENKFEPGQNLPYQIIEKNFKGGFLDMQKHTCKLLQENDADLFHIDGQSFIWGAGMYKKLGGKIPTVAFINNYSSGMNVAHNDYQSLPIKEKILAIAKDWQYAKKRYLWEKFVGLKYANKLDTIFFDSPVIKQIFENFGFKKEKLKVLPEFIDVDSLLKMPINKNSPFKKNNGGFYLLYVGRLTFDKGVDLLIEALGNIAKRDNIFLNIVGDGPQKNYLQKLIAHHQIENRILIHPWADIGQLAQFYAHSDILVHPCRWPEPFGRTIVEAMAFGKPIITTSGSGSAWVMGTAGLIFKKNDASDLIDKLLLLKNSPKNLQRYSLIAKSRAKKFDYRFFAEKFENSLLELTKKTNLVVVFSLLKSA